MKHYSIGAMQAHCDLLTREGSQLSVYWEWQDDCEQCWLELNDTKMENLLSVEEAILDYLWRHFGSKYPLWIYYVKLRLTYDRDGKKFIGKKVVYEHCHGKTDWNIELAMPRQIPFDVLDIYLFRQDSDTTAVGIALRSKHGPCLEVPNRIGHMIKEKLGAGILALEQRIGAFAVDTNYLFNREEAKRRGKNLIFKITSLDYDFFHRSEEDIWILFASWLGRPLDTNSRFH